MAILGYWSERQTVDVCELYEITTNIPDQFRVGYVPRSYAYSGIRPTSSYAAIPEDFWDSLYIRTPTALSANDITLFAYAAPEGSPYYMNYSQAGRISINLSLGGFRSASAVFPWAPGEFGCLRFHRKQISSTKVLLELYWNSDLIVTYEETPADYTLQFRTQIYNSYTTAASANGENGVYYGQLRTDSDPRALTLSVQALRESDLNVWTRQGNFGTQESNFAAAPYTPTNITSKYYESAVAGYLGIAHRDEVFAGSPVLSAKTTVVARRTTASPNSIKLSDRISYAGEKIDSPVIALTTSFDSYSHTYTPAAGTVSAVMGNIEITSV